MPSAAACCTSSSMDAAPSRNEKGEGTCKWTKPAALVINAVQPPFVGGGVEIQLEQAAVGRFHFHEAPLALAEPPAAYVTPAVDDAGDAVRAAPPLEGGGLPAKRCPRRCERRRPRPAVFGKNDSHRHVDETHRKHLEHRKTMRARQCASNNVRKTMRVRQRACV